MNKLTPKQARKKLLAFKKDWKSISNQTHKKEETPIEQALQMGADALDKQEPKKHYHSAIKEVDGKGVYFRFSICPECLGEIISYKNSEPPKYCSNCGQKLKWESDEQ